jgi:uncharacterized membrane protein
MPVTTEQVLGALYWVCINTVLAFIPVGMGYLIVRLTELPEKGRPLIRVGIVCASLIWLLFLPNTCYLLTEWRHFLVEIFQRGVYEKWHNGGDIEALMHIIRLWFFFMAFSALGAISFALAVRPIHRLLARRISMWLVGPPFFFLMSLGVYFGLRQRYNSWEMLTNPGPIVQTAIDAFGRPQLLGLIIGFAICLWMVYLVIDIWVDGFWVRLRRSAVPGAP